MVQAFYAKFESFARNVGETIAEWVMRFVVHCRSCRECHERVMMLEEVCPHCGTGSPAKVPLAMSATAAGVLVVGLILLACL